MSDGDCQLNTFSREVTLMINCVRFAIFSLRLFYAWNVLDQAPGELRIIKYGGYLKIKSFINYKYIIMTAIITLLLPSFIRTAQFGRIK